MSDPRPRPPPLAPHRRPRLRAHRADRRRRTIAAVRALIPIWLKIAYTLFICVLVPAYWRFWGPQNFLWFSDIALLTTAVALWLESSLLASMMMLAIALPELAWNADFFGRLLMGRHLFGLSEYMFDPKRPGWLRALSLFHVVLPIVLVWMVHRLGYDRRAWLFQTLAALVLLPLTFVLTAPAENVNWVYGPGSRPQTALPRLLYLALVMLVFPLGIYLPVHLLLSRLLARPVAP